MGRVLGVLLLFALPAWAELAEQPVHERILFGETEKGVHLMSLYNADQDSVRLRVCAESGVQYSGSCRPLFDREIRYRDLPFYEKRLLEKLKARREQLIRERKESLLHKVIGGPHRDLEALDKIIASIREEGLRAWVRHKRPARPASPNLSSSRVMTEVLKDVESAFGTPPPDVIGAPGPQSGSR